MDTEAILQAAHALVGARAEEHRAYEAWRRARAAADYAGMERHAEWQRAAERRTWLRLRELEIAVDDSYRRVA